jgi:hypothetical protein
MTSVEVEWPKTAHDRAPSHEWPKLRVDKWRILDGKVKSGLMSDSEVLGGSPRLGRLRTTSCWALWNKH